MEMVDARFVKRSMTYGNETRPLLAPYFCDSLPYSGSEDACIQQCDKTIPCQLKL